MRFQKAERCSAAGSSEDRSTTFPPASRAPAWLFAPALVWVAAIGAVAAMLPPDRCEPFVAHAAARAFLVFVYSSSIVLEAAPFVVSGTIAASALTRVCSGSVIAPLLAAIAPGCDCSLSGFAASMKRTAPAVAGFSLTWGAIAGPAALFATHVALGDRMVAARLAGAAVAASLTGAAWRWCIPIRRDDAPGCAKAEPLHVHLGKALAALALTAAGAASVVTYAPFAYASLAHPCAAALAGALLSPCSTADAVIARVLVHGRCAQAAFIVAAQCVDIRQLATIARHFGSARAFVAAIAGCAGCVAAALVAR
jgi:hypothetical protein